MHAMFMQVGRNVWGPNDDRTLQCLEPQTWQNVFGWWTVMNQTIETSDIAAVQLLDFSYAAHMSLTTVTTESCLQGFWSGRPGKIQ